MIVTLTANPSIDRTLEVVGFQRGAVNRATAARVDPGGKGINVARALTGAGVPARAVLPSGGPEGAELLALLRDAGVTAVTIPIRDAVRSNITIAEPDGTITKLNEPGPNLRPDECEALVAITLGNARDADWLALCGSLPPGAPADLYADLVTGAKARGLRVALDSSGAALAHAVDAGPDLIKPNDEELAELTGADLTTVGDVVTAARDLVERGVGAVLASLGADGAVLVTTARAVHAHAPVTVPRSTVGAGDATLAGYLASGTGDPAVDLRAGVAWGAAAVALPGSRMPTPADVDLDAVVVEEPIDLSRPLGGRKEAVGG